MPTETRALTRHAGSVIVVDYPAVGKPAKRGVAMKMKRLFPAVLIALAIAAPAVQAQTHSDYAKERRWASQIVGNLFVGEAVYLQASGHKFLSIYTKPTSSKVKGGAIIIHGKGVHPNWTDVIYPLRTQLPDHGWYTLSLQMPVLPNAAKDAEYSPLVPEAAPRIAAGVAYLKSQGVDNIVLICHSLGCTMAAYYLAHSPSPNVHDFVAVGMSVIKFKDRSRMVTSSLEKIRIPVFDFGGLQDAEQTPATQKARIEAARKAGNKHYTHKWIPGADHFFHGEDAVLVKDVNDWLNRNAVR
jgi:pimeloyl-ACP methyl ester carboxylesterase